MTDKTVTKTLTLKCAIPEKAELDALYDLLAAGEALEDRFCRDTSGICEDILEAAGSNVTDEERAFFMKAWSVLVDNNGGLARLLMGYTTWAHNCQHPGKDYIHWNAQMRDALEAKELLPVLEEGYQEARARVAFLENCFVIFKTEGDIDAHDVK